MDSEVQRGMESIKSENQAGSALIQTLLFFKEGNFTKESVAKRLSENVRLGSASTGMRISSFLLYKIDGLGFMS